MFSKIFKFGSWFTAEIEVVYHDVEKIISDFTATITKLEAAAAAKAQEAEAYLQKSIDLEKLGDEAYAASEKAKAVASKIKSLVS